MNPIKLVNTIEIRPDILQPNKVPFNTMNIPTKDVDEIVIGNWFHLERMNGVNKREWCLILNNEHNDTMNVYITEKDGIVTQTTQVENNWKK
jgi:hypothetical protein